MTISGVLQRYDRQKVLNVPLRVRFRVRQQIVGRIRRGVWWTFCPPRLESLWNMIFRFDTNFVRPSKLLWHRQFR